MFALDISPLKATSDIRGYTGGQGKPGANTTFFTTDVTIPPICHRLALTICVDAASTLVAVQTDGANTSMKLNGGTALTSNCLYTFVFGVRPGQTWNFKIDTTGNVDHFTLEAAKGGF